ncbi:MAG: efflux RND transporter periplasmic adaptor subunit [Bryobacteraceae bacterium]
MPSVGTTEVQLRPMAQRLTVSSELVPFQEIDVYAKEAGYVKQLNVDFGSHVRAGDVMAVLEIPELEAQLQQDQEAIKARNNEVIRSRNMVGRAKAQHDVLHLQFTRLDGVAKTQKGLVAQQEVDDAESRDLASESSLDAAQGALEAAQSEVAVAKAKLMHDQALYDYSKITAPFDGVVTQRFANLGALMQAGTSSTQATPLVRLSQENLYRLVIPVPESYVGFIRINDPVEVKVPALNDTVLGKVARTSIDVNLDTRTMHTEVDVPNKNGKLVPGLYAEATLTLNQRGSVAAVPIQAIDREGDVTSVMVLQGDMTVVRRPITLGIQTANYAEVASGLTPGEQIIVSDRGGLKPGVRVVPHPMEALAYDSSPEKPQ